MIKKLLFTFAIVLLNVAMYAKPVDITAAKTIAINYYKHYANSAITDYSIANQLTEKNGNTNAYYIFNFAAGGFVMVAADDAALPILGFSDEQNFDPNHVPELAHAFFDSYKKEIANIVASHLPNADTETEWEKIRKEAFEKSTNAVTPLLGTGTNAIIWDQGSPFSNLCPSGTPTGCVATSMAQIMRKWNYPTTGTGSHSYTSSGYGVQSANFGATTYNWAQMPVNYSTSTAAQKLAVATLMYHCGVSVDMDYQPAGSGAVSYNVPPAFINYFNYQPSAEVKNRASFPSDALWMALIKADLDAGRPLCLTGDDNGTAGSGHQWVCDGYNASSLFHMNWGWSGSSNAYFALTSLNPSGMVFNSDRQAIIRITPFSGVSPIANFNASAIIPAAGAPVDFNDLSLNGPTQWLWTFDGGTPATSTSQNPTGVTFATNGYHVVSLKVTNANGSDIKTKERYIKVGGAPTVWIKQNSAFATASRGIDQIDIVDANTVWAKAYDGTNPTGYIREFTRTNNGGTNWNPGSISFTNSTNYGVSNIYAFSYDTAYACMFPTSGTGGAIVKTNDGGTTWNLQSGATFTNSWADFVHFFDRNNGVAVGDPTATTGTDFFIYTTSNGGTTWTQVSNSSIPNCQTGEAGIVNYYDAVGNTIWFITNKGRCYKSTNKGLNWTVASTGFTNVYTIHFKDANVGIAVTDTTPVGFKKTIDGGLTWQSFTPAGYVVKAPKIAFVPGTTATWVDVAAYPSNGSTYSTNDGANFMNVDSGSVAFTSVAFWDFNTGWAGSFNASATDDGIYKWNPSALTVGINSPAASEGNISVYPVPSKGIINIGLGKMDDDNMTITVYNLLGAKVLSEQVRAISNDVIQIDLSNKEPGLYFVNINNGGKNITKKIQIQK